MRGWIIVFDALEFGSVPVSEQELKEYPCKFRLLDGDGEVYYYGISKEVSFAPLDEFGKPFAGCTSIEYFNEEVWIEL